MKLWVLLVLEECAQPGRGQRKHSIILDVVSRGVGCVKAPLRDGHENAGKGGFVVGIFREGVDEGVEVGCSVGGAYSKCKFPGVMSGKIETCLVRLGCGREGNVVGA